MTTAPDRLLALIVEDDALLLTLVGEYFRNDGFEVVEAGSGEQAMVELSNGYSFDAVFTDISLGGPVTGWDVAAACRSRWPDVAVVYASGGAMDPARLLARSRFFAKPYQIEQVGAVCRELCAA